jgi:hypothetical protein
MSASTFNELNEHAGHDVQVNRYIDKSNGQIVNVAVECMTCSAVLMDFDSNTEENIILEPVDVWGEDPEYTRDGWREDAGNGDTNLGYWEWVAHRKEFYAEHPLYKNT